MATKWWNTLCIKRLTFFFLVLRDHVGWRNSKLCDKSLIQSLYTLLWLYQIFWRRWWMWNSGDWEWRLSESGKCEEEKRVSDCGFIKSFGESDECEIVETESGEWVRVERVSESRGVWEFLVSLTYEIWISSMKSSLKDSVSRWLPREPATSFLGNTKMLKDLVYKLSLRDLISRWTPCGKSIKSDLIRIWKSSIWDSIYKA